MFLYGFGLSIFIVLHKKLKLLMLEIFYNLDTSSQLVLQLRF